MAFYGLGEDDYTTGMLDMQCLQVERNQTERNMQIEHCTGLEKLENFGKSLIMIICFVVYNSKAECINTSDINLSCLLNDNEKAAWIQS